MWQNIISWFGDKLEKQSIVRQFNKSAANAWDAGDVPTLLKAKVSWGNSNNKHSFSDTFSGFRIIAMTGSNMSLEKCKIIGMIIMSDQVLLRQLMRVGFDTLEVFSNTTSDGFEAGLRNLLIE